jgi:FecR protein
MLMRIVISNVIAALLVVTTSMGAEAATSKIGVTAAAKNDVEGRLGGTVRPLKTGSDVYTNERIRTGEASTAQILLLDKTSLTMGPRAELTLDRFVYNPSRGAGQVVLNALQGAFRFVSGSQNPRSYMIKTPVGTIGVRGTIVEFLVPSGFSAPHNVSVQNGFVIVVAIQGSVEVKIDGKIYTLDHPGEYLVVSANGNVQGPSQWTSTIVNTDVSPPLYGWSFQSELPENGLLNFDIGSIDQLDAIIQHSLTPPPLRPRCGINCY